MREQSRTHISDDAFANGQAILVDAAAYVEAGGTVFLSSHTLEVVEAVCDRIAIIREGDIIAHGTMDELREQSDAGGAHLEEIFLKVTGNEDMADVVAGLQET